MDKKKLNATLTLAYQNHQKNRPDFLPILCDHKPPPIVSRSYLKNHHSAITCLGQIENSIQARQPKTNNRSREVYVFPEPSDMSPPIAGLRV